VVLAEDSRRSRRQPRSAAKVRMRSSGAFAATAAYVICDNNGNPVTPAQAKKIIAERWTVPEDVRKRRRSRKLAGKAPQAALTGPDRRGDPPRPRSSRPRSQAVKPASPLHP